jgi:hypothetical protein
MLEHAQLLLGPWVPAPEAIPSFARGAPFSVRMLLDPSTRVRLGIVKRREGRRWPGWLGRQTLEVYETPDESLLCHVYAPWLLARGWEVLDADERRVASIRGQEILDGHGLPVATFRPAANDRTGKYLGLDGTEFAELTAAGADTLLQFSWSLASRPLVKMALLGAALCRG